MPGHLLAATVFALYRSLGTLATPLIRRHMQTRLRRGREDPERLAERYGRSREPRPAGRLIWIHASSVGEAISTLSLIEALRGRRPELGLLLTTGTVSSARLMARHLPEGVIHQFAPIDQAAAVARFFDHWRPDLGLVVESELWPNLIRGARARHIELILVNGRMSARSFRSWRRVKPVIADLLACFSLVLAQSPEDAERFAELGARQTRCPGNLKFAAAPLPAEEGELSRLSQCLGARPRWLAASTHPGEEEQVAAAHRIAAAAHPGLVTLIVPRHPDRGAAIAESLAGLGLAVARRAAGEAPAAGSEIYIADTFGELGMWYRLAELAFVGGSLVPRGGQNPLEPAKLNCAVLYGPEASNFQHVTDEMTAARAIRRVRDADELGSAVAALLGDPEARGRLARAAHAFATEQVQVLERIVECLTPALRRLEA